MELRKRSIRHLSFLLWVIFFSPNGECTEITEKARSVPFFPLENRNFLSPKAFAVFCHNPYRAFFTDADINEKAAAETPHMAASVKKALYCLFKPPSGFAFADPKKIASSVIVAFVGKGKEFFTPSLNLAVEETDVSLENYLAIIKKNYQKEGSRWIDLGDIPIKNGTLRLTRVDAKTSWGDVCFLQAILPHLGKFFVLTAAAHKKDFLHFQREFLNSIRSLCIVEDLTYAIEPIERRSFLIDALQTQDKHSLEKLLIEKYSDLGPFWQMLILKEGRS